MVTKREVLDLVAERTREGKPTTYRHLPWPLDLSEDAACDHLKRLWQQRLIECTGERRRGFEFRLAAHESVRELEFQLSPRGRKRLRWWRKREQQQEEGWLW